MSTHLEPLSDSLFAPLSLDEQDALMGGAFNTGTRAGGGGTIVFKGHFTYIGVTQVNSGAVVDDYTLDA